MPSAGAAERLVVRVDAKRFPAVGDAPAKLAVADLRLEVEAGAFLALLGPSGCGKTTTLNIVAGLDRAFVGRVERPSGTRIGYVFQEPRLLPWRTVEDNLRLPLGEAGLDAEAWLDELLIEVGLEDVRKVFPTRLSLGMARRAALARAFAVRPTLLLMDEPFVSLDEPTAKRLRRLLVRLLRRHPASVLFVTHNAREAIRLADRIVVLAPSPTRIVETVDVTLSPRARDDDAEIEGFRRRLAGREGLAGLF